MPQISFNDVSVVRNDNTLLQPFSLTLQEHRIGIIGSNGSGKSTLVRLINGLEEPSTGEVFYDGISLATRSSEVRRRVGFVFSDAESQIVMPQVHDDVAFSLKKFKLSKAEKEQRVDEVLERFKLLHKAEQSPHTLSGGEKQLLALAAVLVTEPTTIIADEPTTLLDLRNRRRIIAELNSLDQQTIVVTHDLELLSDFDRVICVNDGVIAYDGTPADTIQFYTQLMEPNSED
ncbi:MULTISPECIES: energy-coupling factor ABC transporter ATP-binding protein [Corynebacterium]|uniref:energy-coupling factor ABC transporter ATP-binding protein n=1 Tax=Corynebacterium TaxID=1716 RepID=UPI0008A592FC|nr:MULTISPECIES: ABC transporter ATP-binding protein [Corynebacterium]MCQ4609028.1 ABC transporter ATP-binding protein [Corynebacterium sp. CCUG 61414]OFT29050.1 cobalt ABC transporter ATP-binding protein [Corynebacterium sp. HMSC08D02]UUA86469.1 energy-coupling factor ABC transporter ATP-binding protein [Corynebacterium pseudogenitalium]WPJ93097.1 ABC transporter ATP-binding protein [Corynebacterium sp. UMB2355A]